MHFPRYPLGVLLTASLTLLACSDDETIVALNIHANDNVGYVKVLKVHVEQPGQGAIDFEITPALTLIDSKQPEKGERIVNETDRRITVDGWKGKADIRVITVNQNGMDDLTATTEVGIHENEVTAAFVDLKREDAPMPMGGMGGGGAGGAAGGGAGGAQAGSGGASAGAGGVAAGAGGAAAGTGGAAGGAGSGGGGGG
jgi:hypothetical protein